MLYLEQFPQSPAERGRRRDEDAVRIPPSLSGCETAELSDTAEYKEAQEIIEEIFKEIV